ncbi:MAG: glycosyltransferase [Candidatus Saelkia tenebricola]|nr:glycosyltransferase [Candidatus Saelkia tenebricola]
MKILVIGQKLVSRIEAVRDYLLSRGHSVSVIGLQSAFIKKRRKPLVFVFSFYIIKVIFSVIVFRKRFDLCIGVSHFSGMMGVVLTKLGICKKSIYYCIDHYKGEGWLYTLQNAIDRWTTLHSDKVWDISDRIVEARKLDFGLYKNKHTIVPVGYDPTFFRYNEGIDRYSIVFVGVMQKGHGLELMLETLPFLIKIFPKINIRIIGRGPFLDEFKGMVKERGLEKYYKIYGFIEDTDEMLDVVASCAVGIAVWSDIGNSYYGDSGKTKLYSVCGLPVIVSNFVIYSEAVIKCKAGIAIEGNKEALINAVKELFSNDNLYWEYKKNAKIAANDYCSSYKIFSDVL